VTRAQEKAESVQAEIDEAHRLVSVADEAICNFETSVRRELRNVKDALLDLSAALLTISRNIDAERQEREKG
jgi:hypothetical protein